MDEELKRSMFEYYRQRASVYDEIYSGGGPASIPDPQAYRSEVGVLANIVKRLCSGDLLDIACGTAFWLPHYADKCNHITLLDQSKEMLVQANARAASAGATDRTSSMCADVLHHDFGDSRFDCVLVAFLMSHFSPEQEATFTDVLKSIAKPRGKILFLDTVWNNARALTRDKEGLQERTLPDGRQFQIYKKYFTEDDVSALSRALGIDLTTEHFGRVFFAASGVAGEGDKPPKRASCTSGSTPAVGPSDLGARQAPGRRH